MAQHIMNPKLIFWTYKRCKKEYQGMRAWFRALIPLFMGTYFMIASGCRIFSTTYKVGKGTVSTTYKITKGAVNATIGAGKIIYEVGEFTFTVVMAPLTWPLTREEIETIDGLPPKEAIKKGRVKKSPYVVNGKRYVPMSVKQAKKYREKGIASWYGYETRKQKGGHMTANGEAFNPDGLNAAHKYLPLPTHVKVTNLENNRSIILRVNDRGPFIAGRIIDLSAGAARKLGYYEKGTARVLVETVELEG
jgi:rare lipoprotein A